MSADGVRKANRVTPAAAIWLACAVNSCWRPSGSWLPTALSTSVMPLGPRSTRVQEAGRVIAIPLSAIAIRPLSGRLAAATADPPPVAADEALPLDGLDEP